METNAILQIYQNWLELDDLQFNALGFCSLPLPSGMVVRLVEIPNEPEVLLRLEIAEVPESTRDLAARLTDEINSNPGLAGGFDLGLNPTTRWLTAQCRLENTEAESVVLERTAALVAFGERWRAILPNLPSLPENEMDATSMADLINRFA